MLSLSTASELEDQLPIQATRTRALRTPRPQPPLVLYYYNE